jgi:hypothetical protein
MVRIITLGEQYKTEVSNIREIITTFQHLRSEITEGKKYNKIWNLGYGMEEEFGNSEKFDNTERS